MRAAVAKRWLASARLRLAIIVYVARRLVCPLVSVALYVVLATAVVRWDEGRARVALPEWSASAYGVFTQLFFECTEGYPPTTIARVVFWATPVVGVFLVAEGLFKVGASIFDIATRREVWLAIVIAQMRGQVVVCGLGHVGYRVVEELRLLGVDVVGIEQQEAGGFVDLVRAMGVPVLIGDARRDDLLEKAGVACAQAVVCATADDLANLEVALDSKHMNPGVRVVLRMFDQRLAGKVGGAIEVDASFSTSSLAAPLIAMQATQKGVHAAYRLGNAIRVTVDVEVGPRAAGLAIAALEDRWPCRVVGRRARGDGVAFGVAHAHDTVQAGDVLVVDADAGDVSRLRAAISA